MEWTYENVRKLWKERNLYEKENKNHGVLIFSTITGILIGFTSYFFFGSEMNNRVLLPYILLILFLYATSLLHVIIHETGHLIAGKLSHYHLVSFRILSIIFFKKDGKLKLKRGKVAGTGGQCLMLPPKDYQEDTCPYVLYNLGGILFDLFFSMLSFVLLIWIQNPYASLAIYIFGVSGIMGSIFNYFHFSGAQIQNDGCNLRAMKADPYARSSFFRQLVIYEQLIRGKKLSEFKEDELIIAAEADITQPLNSFFINLSCMKLLSEQKFDEVDELLCKCESVYETMSNSMKLLIDVERLFLLIYNDEDFRASKTYYKNLKKRMKKYRSTPSVMRTQYCYELLIHQDVKRAAFFERIIKKYQKKVAIPQEIQLQLELMELVEAKCQEKSLQSIV